MAAYESHFKCENLGKCGWVAVCGERLEGSPMWGSFLLRGCTCSMFRSKLRAQTARVSSPQGHPSRYLLTCTLATVIVPWKQNLLCFLDFISFSPCLFPFKPVSKFFLWRAWSHDLQQISSGVAKKNKVWCILSLTEIAAYRGFPLYFRPTA